LVGAKEQIREDNKISEFETGQLRLFNLRNRKEKNEEKINRDYKTCGTPSRIIQIMELPEKQEGKGENIQINVQGSRFNTQHRKGRKKEEGRERGRRRSRRSR
jgi:hypothetical protein